MQFLAPRGWMDGWMDGSGRPGLGSVVPALGQMREGRIPVGKRGR